tara:strand:- start:133 stop:636 length:504 start_codon:yes stop_codon:yes gene_type:complete
MPGIAPSNAYPCADGMVLVAGNGDSIFKRLMNAMGRADLADAPDLEHNDGRVKRIAEIDAAISQWTQTRPADQVLETLIAARVPCGKLYNAADIAADPQYRARGAIQTMTTADGSTLDVPGVLPRLSETPGKISSLAPELGADTEAVLRSIGVDPERFAALRKQGVI